jgi:hypothetical protein
MAMPADELSLRSAVVTRVGRQIEPRRVRLFRPADGELEIGRIEVVDGLNAEEGEVASISRRKSSRMCRTPGSPAASSG